MAYFKEIYQLNCDMVEEVLMQSSFFCDVRGGHGGDYGGGQGGGQGRGHGRGLGVSALYNFKNL